MTTLEQQIGFDFINLSKFNIFFANTRYLTMLLFSNAVYDV